MKIGWKLLLLWTASMALFTGAGLATWLNMAVMEGVSGLAVRFFLGYCGIIIVFQVFSTTAEIGRLFNAMKEKKLKSIRSLLY